MSNSSIAPVRQKDRIEIIDIIRGVALLGILMMNIPYFSDAPQAGGNIYVYNETSGINYKTWWAVNGFFEGTMRALFTMLFGAGCLLLLMRLEKKRTDISAPDIYYRRLLWLLLFGFINAFVFLWPGDILYSYAICGLFLFPFRNMKAHHFFLIGIILLLLTTAKDTYRSYSHKMTRVRGEAVLAMDTTKQKLTMPQEEQKAAWLGMQEKIKLENIRKEVEKEKAKMQQDYAGIWAHLKNINIWLESTKFYSSFFLDIMSLLFLGMALFKWGVLTAARSRKFFWITLIAGYGIGLAASYWWLNAFLVSKFDPTRYFDVAFVDLYQVKRLFLSLGHMSVIILLYKYGVLKFMLQWMKRVGQMAFTNYLMQSIICVTIFYGFGFGLHGSLQRYQQYYVVGAVWIFQIIFSNIWLHYFRFGPFEWVWRSLTYWKKQPMKRSASSEPEEEKKEDIPMPAMA